MSAKSLTENKSSGDAVLIEKMRSFCRRRPEVYKSLSAFERLIIGNLGEDGDRSPPSSDPAPKGSVK